MTGLRAIWSIQPKLSTKTSKSFQALLLGQKIRTVELSKDRKWINTGENEFFRKNKTYLLQIFIPLSFQQPPGSPMEPQQGLSSSPRAFPRAPSPHRSTRLFPSGQAPPYQAHSIFICHLNRETAAELVANKAIKGKAHNMQHNWDKRRWAAHSPDIQEYQSMQNKWFHKGNHAKLAGYRYANIAPGWNVAGSSQLTSWESLRSFPKHSSVSVQEVRGFRCLLGTFSPQAVRARNKPLFSSVIVITEIAAPLLNFLAGVMPPTPKASARSQKNSWLHWIISISQGGKLTVF